MVCDLEHVRVVVVLVVILMVRVRVFDFVVELNLDLGLNGFKVASIHFKQITHTQPVQVIIHKRVVLCYFAVLSEVISTGCGYFNLKRKNKSK